jgi:hypothetical protein
MTTKTIAEYRREAEEQNRKHEQLLSTLEVPEYTNRSLEAQWVTSKNGNAITGTSGWTALAPEAVTERLNVGDPYIVETKGFNLISGWLIDGVWYERKSDQQLQRQHDEYVERARRRDREYADAHRDEWREREAALPEWIAPRIRAFHERPEFDTEPMGWGYELVVCELAVLYSAIGTSILTRDADHDSDEINAFARQHGTSGAQHGMALALARHHVTEQQDRSTK